MAVAQENQNLPATTRQTFAIFRLGGGDVRDQNLTRQQASEMIEKLSAGKDIRVRAPKQTDEFADLVVRAVEAANKAGDEWMAKAQTAYVVKDGDKVVGTMLDVCAIVYLKVTDRRTKFAKWLEGKGKGSLRHKYSFRQEMGLLEACYGAMLKVLNEGGVTGLTLYSRID